MAKRFTDTDKWKKGFLKNLPSPYKIFWLYLVDECTNYGVWDTNEIDVARLRTGETINLKTAFKLFNHDEQRVHEFENGKKWFIPSFVTFQYGEDFVIKASKNRLIDQVHGLLGRLDLLKWIPVKYPLDARSNGQQEQDKDKDMDKEQDKDKKGEIQSLVSHLANGKSTLKLSARR